MSPFFAGSMPSVHSQPQLPFCESCAPFEENVRHSKGQVGASSQSEMMSPGDHARSAACGSRCARAIATPSSSARVVAVVMGGGQQ